jgi:hypothetical protein
MRIVRVQTGRSNKYGQYSLMVLASPSSDNDAIRVRFYRDKVGLCFFPKLLARSVASLQPDFTFDGPEYVIERLEINIWP